jgi:cytoskeleton protein RodZ
LASFGAKLRQEREQRKISLDDISRSTKIGTRLLRALEEEHLDQLPGGIFNKGFIRAYARALGMDEEEIVADYVAATTTRLPVGKSGNPEETIAGLRVPESKKDSDLPWGTLALLLLAVALGLAFWGLYSRDSAAPASSTTTQATPPARTSSTPVSPQTEPDNAAHSPARHDSGQAEKSSVSPQPTPVEAQKESRQPLESTGNPASAQVKDLAAATGEPSQPLASTGNTFRVLIRAREDSWITITVDGEVTIQRTLVAPAQKTVEAQREVIVRAGNVGGLDFEFNGKKLPSEGNSGEVRTLTFDATGLVSTAPKVQAPAETPVQP